MKQTRPGLWVGLTVLAFTLLINLAHAYHAFVTNSSSRIAVWDASEFSRDNAPRIIPGGSLLNAAKAGAFGGANNDALGLLFLVDGIVNLPGAGTQSSCGFGNPPNFANDIIYQNPAREPYTAVFNALGIWSTVPTSSANLQYVCRPGDLRLNAMDNVVEAGTDVYNSGTRTFTLDTFNEILFDDTTGGQLFAALSHEIGTVDLATVLGVGIALDTNGKLIPSSTAGSNTNPIREGFVLLNETNSTPLTSINLPGTITHEIGHVLGLAHTGTILNARGVISPNTFPLNGGNTTPTLAKVPTMYAFSLSSSSDNSSSLEIDDISAITRSYPAAAAAAVRGAISGSVLNQNGFSVNGAAVIAYDSAGNEVGVVVGGNPLFPGNSNGRYRIDFVPPGEYTVILVNLNGSTGAGRIHSFSHIDPIFPSAAFNFNSAYFLNAATEVQARKVAVTAGIETTDVNFFNILTTVGSTNTPQNPPIFHNNSDDGGCQAVPNSGKPGAFSSWLALGFWLFSITSMWGWRRWSLSNVK